MTKAADAAPQPAVAQPPEAVAPPADVPPGAAVRATVVVIIGMAGSGKTTFLTALHRHLREADKSLYAVNLDPAVNSVPFPCNIDIRDTVKYKDVMKEYQLGPNGAILTCLNLFATKFDEVLKLLDKRAAETDYILIDTPGQIEAFNWSASGSLILDALAVSFPTVIAYIVDTARCRSPVTFMSNMIYACSVLYKAKLPFLLVFNKCDVLEPTNCRRWIASYSNFAEDCRKGGEDFDPEDSYMATLSRSCALTMSEFYENIETVAVSSATTAGFDDLLAAVATAREEYFVHYLQWLQQQRAAVKEKRLQLARAAADKFAKDRGRVQVTEEEKRERAELEAFRAHLRQQKQQQQPGSADEPPSGAG